MSEDTVQTKGMGDEILKATHAAKSYVTEAFLTWILYYIGFYIGGLIANLLFLSSSKESMKISGVKPGGRGCLMALLWVHLIIPIALVLGLLGIVSVPFLN